LLPRGQDAATHRDDPHRAKSRASNRRLVGVYGLSVPVGDARAVGPADRGPYYAWGKRESRAMRILGRTA